MASLILSPVTPAADSRAALSTALSFETDQQQKSRAAKQLDKRHRRRGERGCGRPISEARDAMLVEKLCMGPVEMVLRFVQLCGGERLEGQQVERDSRDFASATEAREPSDSSPGPAADVPMSNSSLPNSRRENKHRGRSRRASRARNINRSIPQPRAAVAGCSSRCACTGKQTPHSACSKHCTTVVADAQAAWTLTGTEVARRNWT